VRALGFETYTRAEETYQADVERLDNVAQHVVASTHGDFLKALAEAWLRADRSNKRILFSAWAAIVVKYDLDKEVSG